MMDDDLTNLLHDAVADVEPGERLREIREQTQTPRPRRWFTVGGTALAVAAAVTVVAVVVQRPESAPGPGPAAQYPTPTAGETTSETTDQTATEDQAAAVYYVGRTPDGQRLFREFRRVETGVDPATLVALPPEDPDYRTDWMPGTVLSVSVADGVVQVAVDIAPDAALDIQQLVYTVTATLGENLPVQLTVDGQPVGDPVRRDPDALAPVNISDPGQGREVADHFAAQGAVHGQGQVAWRLVRGEDAVVASGTADRAADDWTVPDIDVSALDPGTYTLVVELDRPEGGASPSDTRTVTVG